MVKVYALSTCPWCRKVKKFFDDEGVSYEVVDVDKAQGEEQKEALAEVEKLSGKRSFPVTVVKDQVIVGFKPEELKEALKNAQE